MMIMILFHTCLPRLAIATTLDIRKFCVPLFHKPCVGCEFYAYLSLRVQLKPRGHLQTMQPNPAVAYTQRRAVRALTAQWLRSNGAPWTLRGPALRWRSQRDLKSARLLKFHVMISKAKLFSCHRMNVYRGNIKVIIDYILYVMVR